MHCMKKIIYLSIIITFFSSCTAYKQVPYFQDLPAEGEVQEDIQNQTILKIQKADILAITVSSLNPEASAIFNSGNMNPSVAAQGGSSEVNGVNGFLVDTKGDIQLPLIGSLKVEGLSTTEARELIQSKLLNYLKEPVVSLRLANLKISVLGDVSRPGVYPVQNEKVSVTEALSMAGDLNITASRKNVLLVREADGKRKFIRLDMNSKKMFNSPYYYLQNNDVIYVQPGDSKYATVDSRYRDIGIALSAISIIILIITQL